MLSAPKLDNLLEILKNTTLNPIGYDKKVNEKLQILYDLLDKIESIADDELKILYISVEKGSIKYYGDFKEAKDYGEVSSYEEFENNFQEDYPDDIYWYRVITSRYKNYCSITINSKNVVYADTDEVNNFFENTQLQELLDFLIFKVEECIKMLKNNTYNEYVFNNLSNNNRFGVIKRSDYWNLYPEIKNKLLDAITQEEIDFFIKNATEKTDKRIKSMTSGKYFECVRLAYENNNYDLKDMTDREVYLKYADGRDEGLSNLNLDSSDEFDEWYHDKSHFGGHPWEIIRGHSFARVNLSILHDNDGYYLALDGSKILRKVEIAKIYLALVKNNIPIQIYDVEILKDAFIGNDDIGIVPNYILPIECHSYFKTYKPKEFINLEDDEIIKYVKWEKLEELSLKKDRE